MVGLSTGLDVGDHWLGKCIPPGEVLLAQMLDMIDLWLVAVRHVAKQGKLGFQLALRLVKLLQKRWIAGHLIPTESGLFIDDQPGHQHRLRNPLIGFHQLIRCIGTTADLRIECKRQQKQGEYRQKEYLDQYSLELA